MFDIFLKCSKEIPWVSRFSRLDSFLYPRAWAVAAAVAERRSDQEPSNIQIYHYIIISCLTTLLSAILKVKQKKTTPFYPIAA